MSKLFRNRVVIMILSIILAFVCAIGFYSSVQNQAKKKSVIKITENITKGTQITESMIKETQVGSFGLENVETKKTDVVGKFALSDFSAGDLILKDKIADTAYSGINKLSMLDGTHRAISVAIANFADGLSDKLIPGDIVSCLITDQNKKTTTPPELTYLEVLAVTTAKGVDKVSDSSAKEDDNMATVTLLASPKQAEMLANANAASTIHMVLVYRGDAATAQQFLDKQEVVLNGE